MVMMSSNTINFFLYDPLSWMHRDHFSLPLFFNNKVCRSIFNSVVIDFYSLPINSNFNHNYIERYIIKNWKIVLQVSFMLACLRYRSLLFRSGKIVKLDENIRSFCKLNIIDDFSLIAKNNFSDIDFWLLARNEIFIFQDFLSETVMKRLAILFPRINNNDYNFIKINPQFSLLKLAVQYAKRYQ
ncbi:hypothetical protein QE177_03505 [Arsenophonus sp. aPb]|uniref:hypothetical protein n=1 Tax=Arsenophonus sp. aPb TaxID=3041619 RepID=UPI002468E782|nr:hypothetical protein [Arsenophonus sp. aPb]WGL98975.1 hypothetical protein QE177_03505 [Arsenophonus sp. aPb]